MKKILLPLLSLLLFAACSEEKETVEEYANWQEVNEAAFKLKYQEAITLGDPSKLDTIRCYSLLGKQHPAPEDFIIVDKQTFTPNTAAAEKFNKTNPALVGKCPLQTSTASVSYRGWLLPSLSHKETGLVFDQSFNTKDYDPQIARPTSFNCNEVVSGFCTALINMHVGDHWLVYIPYQLAYGTATTSAIPAYSMLKFEIILEDYTR